MRVDATTMSLSWIPSESLSGWMRLGFEMRVGHYDDPPVDRLGSVEDIRRLRTDDRLRFGNVLTGWAEYDGERPTSWGYGPDSGLVLGSTTVRLASVGVTFNGIPMPTIQHEPEVHDDRVVLRQTVGGRTGVPLPRQVPHAPFVKWQAPIVWTTLSLTLRADGSAVPALDGASAFPRHWVYGTDGALLLKSGLTDQNTWMAHSFGPRTPWGEQDSEALVAEVESATERELSRTIMRGGRAPEIRRLPEGSVLTRQGDPGEELFLVLDGVLSVEVDGERVAEVGPGAVVGERALLEGGTRTSTLTALTPVRLAVAPEDAVDLDKLRTVAELHRREE